MTTPIVHVEPVVVAVIACAVIANKWVLSFYQKATRTVGGFLKSIHLKVNVNNFDVIVCF